MDYALKFKDRAEFLSAIEPAGWQHESGESISGHPTALVCGGGCGSLWLEDGTLLDGYHVNVRGDLPECLIPFVIIPASPRQIWQ